jgi:hypothetical protein
MHLSQNRPPLLPETDQSGSQGVGSPALTFLLNCSWTLASLTGRTLQLRSNKLRPALQGLRTGQATFCV